MPIRPLGCLIPQSADTGRTTCVTPHSILGGLAALLLARRAAAAQAQDLPDPADPHRDRLSGRRPDRFRRPPGRRQDEGSARPDRHHREQARRQRHDRRRLRRQVRPRRLPRCSSPRSARWRCRRTCAANVPYDPLRDFAPVSRRGPEHHGAGGDAEARHQDRSRSWSRSPRHKPGALTFASTGVGSPPHLAAGTARSAPPA